MSTTADVPTNTSVATEAGIPVEGYVAPGWEAVRDAFVGNFDLDLDPLNAMLLGPGKAETGAMVAIYHRGSKVVDLWGGYADRTSKPPTPYPADALQLVFSTTKGITAIAANLLVQRGELDLDAPVAQYWPEFAAAGKAEIPVRWLLCHRAGLPWTDGTMSMADALRWDPVIEALAAQAPVWEPGSRHGYHATTYGWLVGEVIRRVSGRSVGTFVREELAEPLGLDLFIGLPAELHDRVVPLEVITLPEDPLLAPMVDSLLGPEVPLGRALFAPGDAWREHNFASFNLPEVWAAEVPAANAITDARSLARLYAACIGEVDGVRILSDATIAAAATVQTEGVDTVLMDMPLDYGIGFNLPSEGLLLGGPGSFGHYGAGGSVGFADPGSGMSFSYIMSKMYLGLSGDPRSGRLIEAGRACADAAG